MGKEKETALPKNIRQIGEIRGAEKICIEDYVMTCIHKKEPQEKDGYLGIFYGEQRKEEDGIYLFLRGILEIPDGEEEAVKKELEEQKEKYFPDWDVQGCCVIGQYPTERMKLAEKLNPMSMQLIYHLQEQEENLYWTVEGCYKKLRGYFVFYEQNRRMQQYLADEFKEDRVEKESIPDKAIKSFREKVRIKGEKRTGSMLKLASSFFVVAALVIGAIALGIMRKLQEKKVAVPEQISILSYGGNEWNEWVTPSLTTLRLPIEEMSSACVQLLNTMLTTGEWIPISRIFQLELEYRESCTKTEK